MGLTIASALVALVGVAHLFFGFKEITAWPAFAGKVLGKSVDDPEIVHTATLAKNQGVYNLFLGVGLLLALTPLFGGGSKAVALYLLGCVVVAGIVGWKTLGAASLLRGQSAPAAVAMLLCLIFW